MNILITSAGRRVSLVRAFQKELGKINKDSQVFAADANPNLSSACHVADGNFGLPFLSENSYIEVLQDKCKEHGIKLIIPTIDTELAILAEHRTLFESIGIKIVISDTDFVTICRDKRLVHQFFSSKGIATAKEYQRDNYTLPMFLKPWDGSRSVDTYLIRTTDDLKEFHFANEKLMFLEYLDQSVYDEYTCDLYYAMDHTLKCVVPRKRLEVKDGEVNKGLAQKNSLIPYIQKYLSKIDGARGCLTAQFFMDKKAEKIYGIEINPRFGGGYPLSYLAGANFPKWLIEEYILDKALDDQFDCWEDNLLMLRYDDEILVRGYQG